MDLLKAKIFLDKVNREYARMSKDPENIARIDVDIMQTYIRDLYDAFLNAEPAAPPSHMPKIENKRAGKTTRKTKPAQPPEPVYTDPPQSARVDPEPPAVEEKPAPASPPPPVVKETPPPPPPPPPAPPVSKTKLTDEQAALFQFKEAKELSEKLSQTPIADLWRAISLNDKLLMGNELFGGDPQLFEDAIKNLNNFGDFEQAKDYLIENYVARFDWGDSKRVEIARKLINFTYRRYK